MPRCSAVSACSKRARLPVGRSRVDRLQLRTPLLLTAWFGLICAGGIALCVGYARAERLLDSSLSLGAAALFAGMVISTCAEAWKRIAGATPAEIGDGAALVVVLLWAGIGMLSFQRRDWAGSAAMMVLWPLFLLLREPLAFGAFFVALLLFVGGGDWLGSHYGHPHLGAVLGLMVLGAVTMGAARLIRRAVGS